MNKLETERLILREIQEDDFTAIHSYASCPENVVYMQWGPNTEAQTRDFINTSIKETVLDNPNKDYKFAAVLKDNGRVVGGCDIHVNGGEASMGWILHRDYWKHGYGPEMGKALLKFGFDGLNLHRVIAKCDAENYGSYRVMEKIGMRREGLFIEGRPANKLTGLPGYISCLFLLPVGYTNESPVQPPKNSVEEISFVNTWVKRNN